MDTFIAESTPLTGLTECHNHTLTDYTEQNQTQCQIIIVILGLMNGLLVIVVVGERFSAICKNILYNFLHSQLMIVDCVNIFYLGF